MWCETCHGRAAAEMMQLAVWHLVVGFDNGVRTVTRCENVAFYEWYLRLVGRNRRLIDIELRLAWSKKALADRVKVRAQAGDALRDAGGRRRRAKPLHGAEADTQRMLEGR